MASSPIFENEDFEVVSASLQTSQVPLLLRNKLQPLLPYSIPLLRRCQFHLHQSHADARSAYVSSTSSKAEVWIALARPKPPLQSSNENWLATWLDGGSSTDMQHRQDVTTSQQDSNQVYWIATHLDLSEPGQTQVWIFASWEATDGPSKGTLSDDSTPTRTIRDISMQYQLFQCLYARIRTTHIRHLPTEPSAQWKRLKQSGKIISTPYRRGKVLFGTVSETIWWMHEDWVVHDRGVSKDIITSKTYQAVAREDRPYLKYILPLPTTPVHHNNKPSFPLTVPKSTTNDPADTNIPPSPPPPGFHFDDLQDRHLQTMLDRSPIPRTIELMRTLVSVGLFPNSSTSTSNSTSGTDPDPNPDPIAWGMLGKDASLGSLHTEPEFRGRGFAEIVARQLIRKMNETFRHTDVSPPPPPSPPPPEAIQVGTETSSSEEREGGKLEYAHIDVSTENRASQRVFEKMGARVGWRVGWIEVDLGDGDDDDGR